METGSNNPVPALKAEKEFFDLSFAQEPAWHYYLLLSLEESTLKAGWFHTGEKIFTGFAAYPIDRGNFKESFRSLISSYSFLKEGFKEVVFTSDSPLFEMIPGSFDVDDATASLKKLHGLGEKDAVQSSELINLGARIFFRQEQVVDETLKSHFSTLKTTHHFHPFIEASLLFLKSRPKKNGVFAHLWEERLDLVAIHDGKLQLANTFFIASSEDLAYYLLFCTDQIGMSADTDPLWISGNIDPADENWAMVQTYWKNMHLAGFPPHIKYSPSLEGLPVQHFCNVANLLLCVS